MRLLLSVLLVMENCFASFKEIHSKFLKFGMSLLPYFIVYSAYTTVASNVISNFIEYSQGRKEILSA